MKLIQKTLIILFHLALLISVVLLLRTALEAQKIKLSGAGSDVTNCFGLGQAATNTTTYLAPTSATSTYVNLCQTNKAKQISYVVEAVATSTFATTTLNIEAQWSHDGGTWANDTTSVTNPGNIVLTGSSTYSFTLTGAGTTTFRIPVSQVSDRFLRVNLKTNSLSDGSLLRSSGLNVWMVVEKNEVNN